MPKIILQEATAHHMIALEFNKGGAAVVLCTVEALRRFIPDAEFVSFIQLSDSFANQYKIRVVKNRLFKSKVFSLSESLKSWGLFFRCMLWAILHKYCRINASLLLKDRRLKEYYEASVIVDISMDHYNDDSGILIPLEISRELLFGVLLGKPVVIYAQSVGPFKSRLARWVARLTLNRVSLITVREKISQGFLNEMVINKPPLYVTADPAFLMEPANNERIKEILSELKLDSRTPIVGIGTPEGVLLGGTTTWHGYKRVLRTAYHILEYCLPEKLFQWLLRLVKGSHYYTTLQSQHSGKMEAAIAKIADHLVEKTGLAVILVPHFVPSEGQYFGGEENGTVVAKEIHELVLNKDKITPLTSEYSAQEIKGIIGKCELFISMKMHPTIAATSQCIPTIAIGAHPKYRGIMQLLGQERWVFDRIPEDLITRIDEAWDKREEIRKELELRQKTIKEEALLNAELTKQLLDSTPK